MRKISTQIKISQRISIVIILFEHFTRSRVLLSGIIWKDLAQSLFAVLAVLPSPHELMQLEEMLRILLYAQAASILSLLRSARRAK